MADTPLEHTLPLFRTAWAFVVPETLPRGGEDAARVAVWSALRTARLAPHALFASGVATPLSAWMESVGVRVTLLAPAAAPALGRTPELLAALVLPALESLAGVHHALITDYAVVWQRPVHTFDLTPLPACAAFSPLRRGVAAGSDAYDVTGSVFAGLACWRARRGDMERAASAAMADGQGAATAAHMAVLEALAGLVLPLAPPWERAAPPSAAYLLRNVRPCSSSSSKLAVARSQDHSTVEVANAAFIDAVRDMNEALKPAIAWERGCLANASAFERRPPHRPLPAAQVTGLDSVGRRLVSSFAPSTSYAPSFAPSYAPSFAPSTSYAPSFAPSYAPSFAPSYAPSFAPSNAPVPPVNGPPGSACTSSSSCTSGVCARGTCCTPNAARSGCSSCIPGSGACAVYSPGDACSSRFDCNTNACLGGCCCTGVGAATVGCSACVCWAANTTTAATAGSCYAVASANVTLPRSCNASAPIAASAELMLSGVPLFPPAARVSEGNPYLFLPATNALKCVAVCERTSLPVVLTIHPSLAPPLQP